MPVSSLCFGSHHTAVEATPQYHVYVVRNDNIESSNKLVFPSWWARRHTPNSYTTPHGINLPDLEFIQLGFTPHTTRLQLPRFLLQRHSDDLNAVPYCHTMSGPQAAGLGMLGESTLVEEPTLYKK